jgi:hypothetical protein
LHICPPLTCRPSRSLSTPTLALFLSSVSPPPQFDAAVKGEPAKRKDPRRLKRLPNEVSAVHESKRSSDILRKVLGGSGEGESSRAGGVPTARGAAPKGGRHEAARASQPPITGMKRKRPGK